MKEKVYRVGVIGVGGVAESHVEGYEAAGADIVAIADVDETRLSKRGEEWSVERLFTDYEEMLRDVELDAVSVCVPNALHDAATVAAARRRVHVLCEKPISLSLRSAQEMIDACRAAGVVLQINHRLRAGGAAQKAQQLIKDGVLGNITFIRLRQAHDWGGKTAVADTFGKRALAGGGTLLDNGCHMMDLLRFFGGEVEEVFARTATSKFDIEVEDTSVVSLQLASGALASIENAWTATGWEEGFWIYGTEGALTFTNWLGRPIPATLFHSFRRPTSTAWTDTDAARFAYPENNTHPQSIKAFLDAIAGKRDVICTGEDGREAVRLIFAAYESAKRGSPVKLAEAQLTEL